MTPASTAPMGDDDFEALDAILDDLRARGQAAPEWEFCEGFIAALICSRRAVPPEEYFPVLFGSEEAPEDEPAPNFADEAQASRFLALWTRRWSEVAAALDAQIESLDDEGAYAPEIVDLRGMVAMLPPEEREPLEGEPIPAFAQLWADGFMAAVECWPEDWAPPRDREQAQWVEECLDAIEALTEDDTDPPTLSPLGDDAPPSVSESRLEAYGEAIWAVYDLRALWRSLGPRIDPIRRSHEPGRNDPCPCGSGKKYKKCHGAV